MVDLSESAKTILRHFKVRGMHEKDYETPAALGQLFNHPQECKSAEAELVTAGLVDLAAAVRNWNRNRIRGAALDSRWRTIRSPKQTLSALSGVVRVSQLDNRLKYCGATSRPTCRSSSRPNSSWLSISRLQRRST